MLNEADGYSARPRNPPCHGWDKQLACISSPKLTPAVEIQERDLARNIDARRAVPILTRTSSERRAGRANGAVRWERHNACAQTRRTAFGSSAAANSGFENRNRKDVVEGKRW